MDYIDYQKALGIGFSDADLQKIFIKKIQVFLDGHKDIPFTEDQERDFCYKVAIKCKIENNQLLRVSFGNEATGLQRLNLYINDVSNDFISVLSYMTVFLNSYSGLKKDKLYLLRAIKLALRDSHIKYEVYEDKDGVFLFPKGAQKLDDALVSEPLEWLKGYPESRKSWVIALKAYSKSTDDTASETADKFRKALETFFQEFFNSAKTLENLKSEYGTYMKSRGVPAEISVNFETLQQSYTNYMNSYAKHHDKASVNVLEYIMYQTGNIIRLLITLKQEETENAD